MDGDVNTTICPRVRVEDLVVTTLDDEVLVQDTVRHEAHGFNPMAACIWRHIDGKSSVAEITQRVSEEMGEPIPSDVIWYALAILQRKHLLAEKVVTRETRISRKKAVTKISLAAGLAAVASITIPDAMAHASVCVGRGHSCGGHGVTCCPNCYCAATSLGVTLSCHGTCP